MSHTRHLANDMRQQILAAIEHFSHVLPGQAPIRDFVHHNTLHGFQHMHFEDALKTTCNITGNKAWLPDENFRQFVKQGRINIDDLNDSLNHAPRLQPDTLIGATLSRRDVYLAALLHPVQPVTLNRLNWLIREQSALKCLQPDVADTHRQHLMKNSNEGAAVSDLWQACLHILRLDHYVLHPEELMELDPSRAIEHVRQSTGEDTPLHQQMQTESRNLLNKLLHRVGHNITLRGLLLALTGEDVLLDVRQAMQQHLANYLDQGMAAWHHAQRNQGFYAAWRHSAKSDLGWLFEQLTDWQDDIRELPDDAMDCIMHVLTRMGVAKEHWTHYLERLALDLPGWSGMVMWRQSRPGYAEQPQPVSMVDYLAVRLVLEMLFARRLCRKHWQIEPSLNTLRWHFNRYSSEFYVRHALFNESLPEYLTGVAQAQIQSSLASRADYKPWKILADQLMLWRHSTMAGKRSGYDVQNHAWPLFVLCQHLGVGAADIKQFNAEQISELFACIHALDSNTRGFIWLQAYERHYREQLFNALVNNEGRGRWKHRSTRPEAQITFCMDDREEGVRRHLEELNPNIETLGAAGFFGVAINWQGLDDEKTTALCPVVVTPSHTLREIPRDDQLNHVAKHQSRRQLRLRIKNILHQTSRRSLLSPLLIAAAAPLAFISLFGRTFGYRKFGRLQERLRDHFDVPVKTRLKLNAQSTDEATPQKPRAGFTDAEQATRVENFLRTLGLLDGFAPFILMMGHGSMSQNNPHLAAYDCGACSGRHGGPNARAFAAMANRPEVRGLLKSRGIILPDDTWFLGAEHNTCDETITWYDTDLIPAALQPGFAKLKTELYQATLGSANERCRRLASAPKTSNKKRSLRHIMGRSYDFSEARPELGHATNAAAIIGRRSISQGAFFDRRAFLVSYSPDTDPEGKVLEAILLAVGPVGAGINLEYYFSTVNNDQYGCGSKITHNVTGLFAVMDGTQSDLRTGLPRQMIEIHEAMRLLVVVEAKVDILTAIYQRQPPLQELIGNGWLVVAAKDPDSEQIHLFEPDKGFVRWQGKVENLPTVDHSRLWYSGHTGPLPPVLIKQEVRHA